MPYAACYMKYLYIQASSPAQQTESNFKGKIFPHGHKPQRLFYRVVGKISKTIGRGSKMSNKTPFSTMYMCSQLVRC